MSTQRNLVLCLIALALVIRVSNLYGQTDIIKVVPAAPNTAALAKFGDIPVGLYAGIPKISIPIYQIKSGSLSLPITLNYHAGGVWVEEVASSVGLGWSLS